MATSKTKKKAKPVKKKNKTTIKKIVKKTKAKAKLKSTSKRAISKSSPMTKTNKAKGLVTKFHQEFKPLYEHLLIQQEGESDRTPGGLYIPTMALDRPAKGKVLAVGKGRLNKKGALRPLDIKIGEIIIFGKYAGSKIMIEGAEYLILKESEVLGVVRDN